MDLTTPLAAANRFRDRHEAGRLLGELVAPEVDGEDVVVLALPRGASRSRSRSPHDCGRRWTSCW